MKRSRGRGRKSTNFNNRTLDSSGPDVKIRGSASHIFEKYQTLARDANSAGDRIGAENLLQHAEHYFRVMRTAQANIAANAAANANANGEAAADAEAANGQTASGALDAESKPQDSANGDESQEAAPKTARRRKGRRTPPANGKGRKSSGDDKGESSADVSEEASA